MAGYSKRPLVKKLGIKENVRILVLNYSNTYAQLVEKPDLQFEQFFDPIASIHYDFIHLFCKRSEDLEKYAAKAKSRLKKDGMLWISWPKKSSGYKSDLNDMVIRNYMLHEIGLVDIKVAAVDDFWSALKFVYRVQDR